VPSSYDPALMSVGAADDISSERLPSPHRGRPRKPRAAEGVTP
jgi:hypothetical protein